jgi:hypothetical protein
MVILPASIPGSRISGAIDRDSTATASGFNDDLLALHDAPSKRESGFRP